MSNKPTYNADSMANCKAPEPTGDDKWKLKEVEVTRGTGFEFTRPEPTGDEDWEEVPCPDGSRILCYERKADPKAPDVIEVELPPLLAKKERSEEWSRFWNRVIDEREAQLLSEIAVKNEQAEYVAFWKKEAINGNTAIKKAEKERDAAVAEVEKFQALHNTYVYGVMAHEEYRKQTELQDGRYKATIDQLQRDLATAKADYELCVDDLAASKRDLDAAGNVLGQICVAGTLCSGEKITEPIDHASVRAILGQIDRAEKAERDLDAAKFLVHFYRTAAEYHKGNCACGSCDQRRNLLK